MKRNEIGAEGDDADGISVDFSNVRGKFERWAIECRKPRYQSPCTAFQKYECVLDVNDRWRMQKCGTSFQQPQTQFKKKWCKCKALSRSFLPSTHLLTVYQVSLFKLIAQLLV